MARLCALLLSALALAPAMPATGQEPRPAAGERSLAVHPDRRRVEDAVWEGFRTRVSCRGGCAKVKLRVYISSLTARTLHLGTFDGDVEVGGAPAIRDAEGRREVDVFFRPAVQRRLARARRLRIAVEAVATDPDGRTRSAVKRLTLRR